MANLAFHLDGQSYVSDAFSGGKAIQLSFPSEGNQVLFVESRLGSTLPWKTIDSRVIEHTLIINVPSAGDGQEFRLNCIAEPTAAEIVPQSSGSGSGSQPAPNSVGTDEIKDDSILMEDLNQQVKDEMMTGDDRVSQDELDGFEV